MGDCLFDEGEGYQTKERERKCITTGMCNGVCRNVERAKDLEECDLWRYERKDLLKCTAHRKDRAKEKGSMGRCRKEYSSNERIEGAYECVLGKLIVSQGETRMRGTGVHLNEKLVYEQSVDGGKVIFKSVCKVLWYTVALAVERKETNF